MNETAVAEPPIRTDVALRPVRDSRVALFVLAAFIVMAAGFWVRLAHLDHPMRNDESFTYIVYLKQGDYFSYSMPNNHVLNTLLMAASTKIAGDSPAALRFPAFLFGMLVIPLAGLLCFQLCRSGPAAIAAMALAASSTALVEYSVNARGYTLIAFAATAMACLTMRLRESPGWKTGWILWVICGVAGLYAIPVMVYSIVPLALLLLADSRAVVRQRITSLAISLGTIGLIALLLYLPLIRESGLASITANPYVTPEALPLVWKDLAGRFAEVTTMWRGNGSMLFVPFLCAGTLLCVYAGARREGNRALLLGALAIAAVLALAFVQRRVAPPRVYLYLQVWMIACACAGAARLLRAIPRPAKALEFIMALILICIAAENWLAVWKQPLLISEDPHTYVEAKEVAARVIGNGADQPDIAIIWNPKENLWPPFLYYFLQMHSWPGFPISWHDPNCKRVFILLGKSESIVDIVGRRPDFLRMYAPPSLLEETANGRVYMADRR